MKKPWSMNAKAGGELEVLLFEEIGESLWGSGGTTAKQFEEDLRAAGKVSAIRLKINSGGGDCFQGLAIYNALLANGAKVTATVVGLAASIASVIMCAASEISVCANALVMIHLPYTMTAGDANDMKKTAEVLDKMTDSLVAAYQRHTSKTKAEIIALMTDETWFNAQEAVDAGFAEQVIDDPDDEPADLAARLQSPILARCRHVPQQLTARVARGAKERGGATEAEREKLRLRAELLRRLLP
jgi:ATP-dependent Clp protease protease subunit